MLSQAFTVELPAWVEPFVRRTPVAEPSAEERMRFVIALLRQHIGHAGGGPFAAAVFEIGGAPAPVGVGVNLVVPARCSVLHAEIVAIMMAQQALGTHDLGASRSPGFELVTSAEPCAMCLGAVRWSGVRSLVCGAHREDVEAVGFDEGPRAVGWTDELAARGIEVTRDVLRADAAAALDAYRQAGGIVYNSHQATGDST